MKVWDFRTAFSFHVILFFQLTCRPGAVVFVLRKRSSKRIQLWNDCKDAPVHSIHFQITLFHLKSVEKEPQPRSLEWSWKMKPCLSVIVTEESSLISQRYYPPPPCLPSLLSSPFHIVLQDQVHGGWGWRRVMGPLSLCFRAGWMGLSPLPPSLQSPASHTGSLNRTQIPPLFIILVSSFCRPARLLDRSIFQSV